MDNQPLEFWFRLLSTDSPAIGRVICLAERDNTYHVETRINGRWFSAHFEEGVRWTNTLEHTDVTVGYWDIIKVPELATGVLSVWADSVTDKKYDWFGALNSVTGIPLADPYKFFCSEVASRLATMVGITVDPLPSPSLLRKQLMAHAGIVSASANCLYPVASLKLGDEECNALADLVNSGKIGVAVSERVMDQCVRNSA